VGSGFFVGAAVTAERVEAGAIATTVRVVAGSLASSVGVATGAADSDKSTHPKETNAIRHTSSIWRFLRI
ncbi:MAG TPA: hypothetical protein VF478_03660, partial [Anaerolineae bacterium]